MLKLTFNQILYSATLELSGFTADQAYVVGDQLRAKLTFTAKYDLVALSLAGELNYLTKGPDKVSTVTAHRLKIMPHTKLTKGQTHSFDVSLPFCFGRPNFNGRNLKSYWELKITLLCEKPYVQRTFLQLIPGQNRTSSSATFRIPVIYGKGHHRAQARTLPIPLISERVVVICCSLVFGYMAIMTILTKDIAANLQNYISLAVTGLLISVGFHFLRLTSFKMTPMEIKPLRDGRLRVHYLNRGKNHFKRSFIGIRLKESYVTIDSNKQLSYKSAIIHEDRYRLDSLTRPLDHLNEVVIPWPLIEGIEYPSTYQNESQGYMWELFLAVPGLVLGDYNEIKWPIQVDWEQLHTSPPSPHELEEEKLELRELADNQLKR